MAEKWTYMLNFVSAEPSTTAKIRYYCEKYSESFGRICDYSAGSLVFWRKHYNTAIAEENNTLIIKFNGCDADESFALPIGEQADAAIEAILKENSGCAVFCCLTKQKAERIMKKYPDSTCEYEREWSDYIYLAEDIKSLAGRRFSGQRNHINKFLKSYPDWSFEEIGAENLCEFGEFCKRYFAGGEGKLTDVSDEEYEALLEQIDNWELCQQVGGLLKVGGEIVGFSIGEVVGDTLIVHTEKALRSYSGAYPMLVRCFARAFAGDGVEYINREEDVGDEGLRTSKLSYHPIELVDKYIVSIKTS